MFTRGKLFLVLGLAVCAQAASAVKSQQWKLPLEFEANRGQFAAEVLFLARTPSHFVYLTRDGMTLGVSGSAQRGAALQMTLVDADPSAAVTPESPLPGISNYFIGNNPSLWQREVPHYGRIHFRAVWPGIDLVYHGRGQALEYDFAVSPGADPSAIRLRYANADGLRVDPDGNLAIETSSGKVVQRLPEIYQESGGVRRAVRGGFRIAGNHEVRFEVGGYDHRRPLVIDPTVTYSTYVGGTGTLAVNQIAVDSAGSSYITGQVSSPDFPVVNPIKQFPTTVGLFRSSNQGATWGSASSSLGTAKVLSIAPDPSNSAVAYAGTSRGLFKTTTSGNNWALANSGMAGGSVTSVAVDPLMPSTVYVCTPQGLYKSTDGAATWKLLANAGACLVVAIDAKDEGIVWLGYSYGPPVTSFDGGVNFYSAGKPIIATSVAIDPVNTNNIYYGTGSLGLLKSTDRGLSFTAITSGLAASNGSAVTVNSVVVSPHNSDRVLVGTNTGAFLSFSGGASFQPTQGIGTRKVLSVLFDPTTDGIAFAGTAGGGVYVSADGGQTWTATGPANLDVNALAMSADEQSTFAGLYSGNHAFVTKINPTGTSMVYSTYLGGGGFTSGNGIAVDSSGHAFVCGSTDAPDFPTQNPYQPRIGGGSDIFISRLSPSGSTLDDSTFLGGRADDSCYALAIEPGGNVYLAGTTILLNSTVGSDFPATPGVFGKQTFGGQDCVVAKFDNSLQKPIYATFLGGNDSDACYGIAADSSGAYVVGTTFSANFLTTRPPFGGTRAGGSTSNIPGFVAKITPDGTALIYSGLLGGTQGATQITGIAVDRIARAYVTGYTRATDYPFTNGALNKSISTAGKTVVSAIEFDGSNLVYSTALPGSNADYGLSIAVDSNSNAWVTGGDSSGRFPVTPDALPHTVAPSAFTPWVAEVDATGSTLLHATYLGGSGGGSSGGVALGADGSVYVAGTTLSTDFTLTGTPFKQSPTTDYNAYVMRLVFPATSGGGGGGGTSGPTITSIQNGASFQNGFAAGAWMTIKGTNLSAVTDTWDKSIVNNQLPTMLDGVSVSVGGQPAYVNFVSSGQINVVAPNIGPGPVNVTVTNALGASAAFSTAAQTVQPAFFQVTGTNYAIATHQDYTIAAKNGTFAGVPTVAAKPGEVIILWGTGFGPTSPAAPAGSPTPAGSFPTTNGVMVTVGNVPATVYGGAAALASGFAALYQVAIQIPPSLPDGDYPVVATVGGQSSPSAVVITVQQ